MNMKDIYNRIAEDWVKDHEKDTWGIPGADKFMTYLPKGAIILDVGCGGGIKTNYLAEHGYKVTGIDFSEKMIEIAKRSYPNSHFEVLDMYDIDTYPHRVDGIFVQAALLHIEKVRVLEVLQKMVDKLHAGGVLYIAVKEMREKGLGEEIKTENDYGYEYHRFFSYYSLGELKGYYQRLGIDIVWQGGVNTGSSQWIQIIGKKYLTSF
jgi:2-polyprenyl-3-methyl-5-hydroxy-6-metoxy-1,4-benzoquinol methylase